MTEFFTLIASVVLLLLTLFQLALIFGAPIGRFAWGGAHDVLPVKFKVGSVVSIVLYTLFAAVLLDKANIMNVISNDAVVNVSIWVVTAYFFVGIAMNAISKSKPERAVMTPTAFILAVSFLGVALG